MDAHLGGGLALGRWHELGGEGLETETAAATAAFAALLARPLAARGAVVWIMRRDDLFAPGLGLCAVQVVAPDDVAALAALEDALGAAGVAAVVGEVAAVGLTAGRRLQLACERHGATGLVIRRRPFGGPAQRGAGSAAESRWKIASAPSGLSPQVPGLGPPRWRVELERCRGGRPGTWMMEQQDGPHPFRMVAELGGLDLAAQERLAG